MIPLVLKYVRANSVLDVGCGVGTWLSAWKKYGLEITGLDGDYVPNEMLFISSKAFIPTDLSKRILIKKRFDIVSTLEVAEHLPKERGESFVEDLTRLSDVILFSAAIPGQGGTNHVNEQWQSYWRELFRRRGFSCFDIIRPHIWGDNRVDICYRQNTFLYVKSDRIYKYPELMSTVVSPGFREEIPTDIVHPALFVFKLQQAIKRLSQVHE